MSWFGLGGKKRSSSNARDLVEEERERQIKLLKQTFPSIRRPNNNDALFEIRFHVEATYCSLKIFVPADFPNTRPVLQLVGSLTHSWLDSFKRVTGCPKLNAWGPTSSLLEVVEDTLAVLTLGSNAGPPTAAPVQQQGYPPTAAAVGVGPPQYNNHTQQQQQQYSGNNYNNIGNNQQGHSSLPPYLLQSGYPGQQQQQQQQVHNPYQSSVQSGGNISYGSSNSNNSDTGYPQQQQQQQQQQQLPTRLSLHQSAQPQPQYNKGIEGASPQSQNNNDNNGQSRNNRSSGSWSPPRSRSGIPDCVLPTSFPELQKMSILQLQRLAADSVALEAILENAAKKDDNIASIEDLKTLRDDMRRSNVESAMENQSLEESLVEQEKKNEALRLKLATSHSLYKEKLKKVQEKFSVARENVEQELKKQNEALDASSEKLGDDVIEGKMDMTDFLKQYITMREEYHATASKLKMISTMPSINS